MKTSLHCCFFVVLCTLVGPGDCMAQPTYRVVTSLPGTYQSTLSITEVAPGVFNAMSGAQVIYSVTTAGSLTTLATFPDPPYTVESPPVAASNGLVYSSFDDVTQGGGFGNLFSVATSPGTEQTYPAQSLTIVLAGNLPTANLFGIAVGFPSPFILATAGLNGKVTPVYTFPTGDYPSQPIYGTDGNYYGVSYNVSNGQTTYFYRITPSGSFTKIASIPYSGTGYLLQGSDGNFYGIQPTSLGCSSTGQDGAVYKLTPSGQFTILHDFGLCGNAIVNSLIEGSDGKLYGDIQGNNRLFSLTRSGVYKVEFVSNYQNGLCPCHLTQGSDGKIYGANIGGGATGDGVIFSLDTGMPVPKPRAQTFVPASGAVGTQVRIWGYNLFGAAVEFNGVAATNISNSGPNYLFATVPPGATSGPITVTTPGGTVTTHTSFTVN